MIEVFQSETFARWLGKLKDRAAAMRINARIRRLTETGNSGDAKPIREGISEMRIDYGPGYRVYFTRQKRELIVLLAGGDKSSQVADIKTALRLAREL